MSSNSRQIQSLERAMHLLELIRAEGGRARLNDLAALSGLGKSTVHGLLDTLMSLGYVSRDQRHYALGLRLRQLAQPVGETEQRLRQAFTPALRAFAELCGERCFLAVPGGTRAYLTLAALDGRGQPLQLPADTRRDGLTTSAIGKVLLAHDRQLARQLARTQPVAEALTEDLRQVANQGYALDLAASRPDLHCFALPLRLRGQVVAALGAGGPAERLQAPVMRRMASRAMRSLFDLVKC
ncbi:IclR family transcriptional regulator [Pseudomonas muyukensis]|uniref:Helix-turn-helix domain-containing protein n=1 Tax=Pseudomonas muyukensis TaxID=2842357 RepID=A0ABX8M3B6_9PSED|nr:helix-turn-helix domain-containing protein [Pseudomonas muyukensis]QXH33619.1 helix-turn-helix domain-containing protein [Pseudomonas muyukensis]